eukprot:gene7731-17270_t
MFVMSNELCATPRKNCEVHVRTSPNGIDWGDVTYMGWPVLSLPDSGGHRYYFAHAPVIAQYSDHFILLGQMLYEDSKETLSPLSGKAYFNCSVAKPPANIQQSSAAFNVPHLNGEEDSSTPESNSPFSIQCSPPKQSPVGFFFTKASYCPNYSPGVWVDGEILVELSSFFDDKD